MTIFLEKSFEGKAIRLWGEREKKLQRKKVEGKKPEEVQTKVTHTGSFQGI